jgi:hypothetical protein
VWVGRISGGNRAAALRCCGSPGGGKGKSTEGGARLGLKGQARLHWKKDKEEGRAHGRAQIGEAAPMGRLERRGGRSGPLPDVEGGEMASAGAEGGGRKNSSTRGAGRRRAQSGGRGSCTSGGAEGKQSRGGSGTRRKKGEELNWGLICNFREKQGPY